MGSVWLTVKLTGIRHISCQFILFVTLVFLYAVYAHWDILRRLSLTAGSWCPLLKEQEKPRPETFQHILETDLGPFWGQQKPGETLGLHLGYGSCQTHVLCLWHLLMGGSLAEGGSSFILTHAPRVLGPGTAGCLSIIQVFLNDNKNHSSGMSSNWQNQVELVAQCLKQP